MMDGLGQDGIWWKDWSKGDAEGRGQKAEKNWFISALAVCPLPSHQR
jgi:hypothetical protein